MIKDTSIFAVKVSVIMLFTTIFLVLLIIPIKAHGQIGIGTTTPDTNTVLEIHSESKGILIPRMTKMQLEKIKDPPSGLMIYVTDSWVISPTQKRGALWIFDGVQWGDVLMVPIVQQ